MADNGAVDTKRDELAAAIEAQVNAQQERQDRIKNCSVELHELLERHKCRLGAVPQIVDGKIVASPVLDAV
ncbi:MAG: hypothetical protein GTO41_27545 [Burkholderiales bacterium]|nr:hypothetical protein [Burkholderiales bacterium]